MGQNITPPATTSGIKVLDRAMLILVTIGEKPRSLTELCEATGLPRATAHRLASALETHHILTRTADGRWTIGAVLTSLGARSATTLVDAATWARDAIHITITQGPRSKHTFPAA